MILYDLPETISISSNPSNQVYIIYKLYIYVYIYMHSLNEWASKMTYSFFDCVRIGGIWETNMELQSILNSENTIALIQAKYGSV